MTTLCECGCGKPAPIAYETNRPQGRIKGQSMRFVSGHNGRIRPPDPTPLWERVLAKCVRVGACLVWQGTTVAGGYGMITQQRKRFYVHRVVYEHIHGQIPDGYEVDHVYAKGCRSTACCEPDHLEAVTPSENCLRRERARR